MPQLEQIDISVTETPLLSALLKYLREGAVITVHQLPDRQVFGEHWEMPPLKKVGRLMDWCF